ncbi:MAG: LPXTG cell wall anchor domain-containing protein [Bacilli bacterium]|nr:LPXTG cell wall anchor domain-containing protein [Bacilli bacterium]
MKKRNLFVFSGLALGLTFSMFGLSKVKSDTQAVKADNETTFYLDCTGFSGWDDADSVCLHVYKSEGNVNEWIEASKAGDNYWYVSKDVTGYTGVEWYRCSYGNVGNHFNKQSWLALPSESFYYEVASWDDPGDNMQWSNPAVWSLAGSSSVSLNSFKFDGDGFQYYKTSVQLAAGDVIEFTDGTKTSGFADLRDAGNGQTAKEKGLVEDDVNGKVKVVKDGYYDIYVNCKSGKVWMQSDAFTDATHWAEEFIEESCADEINGTKAKWGELRDSFDGLTEGAKGLLKNEEHIANDAVADNCIKQAVQRYDYVLQRFGVNNANNDTYGYEDFMGRVSGGKINLSPRMNSISIFAEGESSNSIIVTLIIVSLLATGGALLFLRKRKSNYLGR